MNKCTIAQGTLLQGDIEKEREKVRVREEVDVKEVRRMNSGSS